MVRRFVIATALAATVGAVLVGPANAAEPRLETRRESLSRALDCDGLTTARRSPVLLIHGSALSAETNFDWNYARAFEALGIPFCMITLPNHAMGDIQVSAEYVVYALRHMNSASGRRTQVVGYSQGGMITRWALKYWPRTRAFVDDVVGIDPSNHGSLDSVAVCKAGCAPAMWQQTTGSQFLTRLNDGAETWAGISYTQVYTLTSEIVFPNLGPAASSPLTTGNGQISNITVQRICPLHVAEHLTMGTIDPVAFAVVIDALINDGPARPGRVPRSVCTQLAMPHLETAQIASNELRVAAEAAINIATYPHVDREPAVRAYAE